MQTLARRAGRTPWNPGTWAALALLSVSIFAAANPVDALHQPDHTPVAAERSALEMILAAGSSVELDAFPAQSKVRASHTATAPAAANCVNGGYPVDMASVCVCVCIIRAVAQEAAVASAVLRRP
jgi:hypothetical protein